MRERRGDRHLNRRMNRRSAIVTMAGGVSLVAAPAIVAAQTPLSVSFVQQHGLIIFPLT